MLKRSVLVVPLFALIATTYSVELLKSKEWKSGIVWPEPAKVNPDGENGVPSDAIVLFDGTDMSAWEGGDKWEIKDGYAVVKSGVKSKQKFGDCQLHIEWASPPEDNGSGQGKGNSGVYMMGKYEVQILDSFENKTYPDGQCGAIYKQSPPMVNACRPAGEWQTYDIIFRAPRFKDADNEAGFEVASPGMLTVLHNGVVIHNHFALQGGTFWHIPPKYDRHGEKEPIHLQHHGDPVRFRKIWVRELSPIEGKKPEEVSGDNETSKP